jgi:ANTAR domain
MSQDHSQTPTRPQSPASEAGPSSPGARVPREDAVLRRTPEGWRVGADDLPDLTCAMVLADLLAAELPSDEAALQATPPQPAGSASAEASADEARRLRTTISQLQHALTARVRVEQAIGVLAERHRIRPRQAFEQLRSAARNRGRRVIDIAADVVASATNPLLQLPEELSRPRSAQRLSGRQRRHIEPEPRSAGSP